MPTKNIDLSRILGSRERTAELASANDVAERTHEAQLERVAEPSGVGDLVHTNAGGHVTWRPRRRLKVGAVMRGFIGNKQALCHLGLIWREFGPKTAARCVRAMLGRNRSVTFLDIAFRDEAERRR